MNCVECQEYLVAWLEGALEEAVARQCQHHLETCKACRAEQATLTRLRKRLIASGQAVASVSVEAGVMRQIRAPKIERISIMNWIRQNMRWGYGLSAATVTIGVIIALLLGTSPTSRAKALDVMARGASVAARLATVHLKCQVRTLPADNFSQVSPDNEFVPVEIWKEFSPGGKWRVEKPGRVAVMDGKTTLMLIRTGNVAVKGPASASAFDTQWLHQTAAIQDTIETEIRNAQTQQWEVKLSEETGAGNASKSVVTILAKSGVPDGDYLKNKFFNTADTKRVYRFDSATGRLEDVKVYLRQTVADTLIMEVTQIEYDVPLEAAVFNLELPENVSWYGEPKASPKDAVYAQMTPEQAARTFFEACAKEDWAEVAMFWPMTVDQKFKDYLGGLELIKIGDSFTSKVNNAKFVPYEIKLKASDRVKKWNLALKQHPKTGRWFIDGGL